MDDEVETLEVGLFAVDAETRTVRGVLVPWGETSRTSISKTKPVRFDRPEDLRIPRDVSVVGLNRMHDRFDWVGRAVELDPSPKVGLVASFRIAETDEGDAWLADHGNLVRLSAEVKRMRRRADGSATAELCGAALVDEGAFAGAALFAIDKPADDDDEDEPEPAPEPAPETPEPAPADTDTEPDTAPDNNKEEEDVDDNTDVPDTFAGGKSGKGATGKRHLTAGEMFAIMHARRAGTATPEMRRRFAEERGDVDESALFALSDIDYDGASGVGAAMTAPAWIGEVIDGTEYIPRFSNLFGPSKPLTALAFGGWKWGTKPAGGTWSGNKSDIPSNTPTVTPVNETAERWAGGHDHAREHRDFNTPGYFESYYAAMVESYFRWLDEDIVLTEMLAGATEIEADNPAGLAIGSAMSALIDGAAAVIDAGLVPTFAVLPTASWKQILKTPKSDALAYLEAALNLDSGSLSSAGFVIRGSSEVANPVVGSRSAADVYELPGSPIRVEALDIARGGIDTGLFGYGGLHVKNALGIVEVTPYTP